ncbi:MAG: WYL domain-containing protein [Pseudomonadota bacterium]
MARGEQISRQWRILRRIEAAGANGITIATLAENEKAHSRTIRRDVLDLQYAGFPLVDSVAENGEAARWSVLRTKDQAVQIPFLPSELMALHIAYSAMKAYAGTPFFEAIEELYRKIEAVLPPKSAAFLSEVRNLVADAPVPVVDYGPLADVVQTLNQAILQKKTVKCVYFALYRNKKTRRKIDPYSLRFHDGGIYLIGYCHLRKDIRTFALQRIQEIEVTDRPFTMAEGFSVQDYVDNAFGVHSDAVLVPDGTEEGAPPVQTAFWEEMEDAKTETPKSLAQRHAKNVAILFSKAIAPLIRERTFHRTQKLEAQKDGAVLLKMQTSGLVGVERWVLSFGAEAKVLAPRELREAVARRLSDAAGQYN